MNNTYLYPQIYIKLKPDEIRDSEIKNIIQNSALIEEEDENGRIKEISLDEALKSRKLDNTYFKVIYEPAYKLFLDLENTIITRDIIVFLPWTKEYIKIKSGTKVELLEIAGKNVYLFVREGDRIEYNNKIAYILTGKLEVRTYRSPSKGVIVYITTLTEKPLKYLLVVVDESNTRRYSGLQ
ncbi:MAG TPA: DUF2118 domain-containing protein [Desulfurococcales archaeon]|nr:DUF2118 domain-containing protein [Desulfurococcales archaeon]